MNQPLQPIGFRDSFYERPSQKWVCGWSSIGEPCRVGPDSKGRCRATAECVPRREGDRWDCTRPDLSGGKCPDGPLPDGSCCRSIPRCAPRRSLRARRGLVSRWLALMTLVFGLFLVGDTFRPSLVSPGDLTFHHAEVRGCGSCHTAGPDRPAGWISAAFGSNGGPANGDENREMANSEKCLECHKLGDDALRPHSRSEAALRKLHDGLRPATEPPSMLLLASLSSRVFGGGPAMDATLSCGTCHGEHQGKDADITLMSDARCQACHTAKFASFSDGHPRFDGYPFKQRTRLIFDHVSHFGKHFKDEKYEETAQRFKQCGNCHVPDSAGRMMLLTGGFDRTCAGCHLQKDIRAAGGPSGSSVALLALPGLDLETLRENGVPIGEWPESDAEIPPIMRLLLANDPDYPGLGATIEAYDLLDLEEAAENNELGEIRRLVWAIKSLLSELVSKDGISSTLQTRVTRALGRESELLKEELLVLGGGELIEGAKAVSEWLPELSAEAECIEESHSGSGPPALSSECAKILAAKEPKESDDADEPAPEGPGWYWEDLTLQYRLPARHAGGFMREWLNESAGAKGSAGAPARKLFASLRTETLGEKCVKCHSVEGSGDDATTVNWFAARPTPRRRGFTKFSHDAHLSLLDKRGCRTCHTEIDDPKSNYQAQFKTLDPDDFVSNFKPIDQGVCMRCHTASAAGDSCLTCHNYHVGIFPTYKVETLLKAPSPQASGSK